MAEALSTRYSVHVIGLGDSEPTSMWVGYPHHELDVSRTYTLLELAAQLSPEFVILIGQAQLLSWQVIKLRRSGFQGFVVAYTPVEGPIYDSRALQGLIQSDLVVAYTKFGAAELERAFKTKKNLREFSKKVVVIPHAIDRPTTHSDEPIDNLRARLFPDHTNRLDGPWILNANRNDHRKQPEVTMRAFARMAEKHPQVKLVMHCDLKRRGLDLRIERDRLRLGGKVIFTKENSSQNWTDQKLHELYRCCEIGVNTSLGEGWGLVSFEHALAGAAQILLKHQGLIEIWEGAPKWVPVIPNTVVIDEVSTGHHADLERLASSMLELVENTSMRKSIALQCFERACSNEFTWITVGEQWLALIHRLEMERIKGHC